MIKRFSCLTVLLAAFYGTAMAQISGAGQVGCNAAPVTGTGWTSATTINTVQVLASNIAGAQLLVTLDQTTTISGGAISFLGDPGDGTFVTLNAWQVVDPTSASLATISLPYTLVASTNKQFLIQTAGYYRVELKLTTAITGSATVTPYTTAVCNISPLAVQSTNANLNASVTFPSAQSVNNTQQGTASQNIAQVVGATPSATNPLWTEPTDGTNAMGAMANFGTAPSAVKSLNANAATYAVPSSSSSFALTSFEADAVTTATTVKSSAGNFYGYLVTNTNTSTCYLQVFNTTSPTLGTTAPILSIGIPASSTAAGAANFFMRIPVNFSTAIAVAATTASKGASTCGTGMTVVILYE